MLSDKEIIEGIASNKNSTLHFIYEEIYPSVEGYILQNGGTADQAKDVFQESLIIILNKIQSESLELYCKFSTYLYAVSKRVWIQDRRKEFFRSNKLREAISVAESENTYGNEYIEEARELFLKHFVRLPEDCQKLLTLYFNNVPIEEIRREMKFKTDHHASDKKYRCKKNLIERIRRDPNFRKFKK